MHSANPRHYESPAKPADPPPQMIVEKGLDPLIVFAFGKNMCETLARQTQSLQVGRACSGTKAGRENGEGGREERRVGQGFGCEGRRG